MTQKTNRTFIGLRTITFSVPPTLTVRDVGNQLNGLCKTRTICNRSRMNVPVYVVKVDTGRAMLIGMTTVNVTNRLMMILSHEIGNRTPLLYLTQNIGDLRNKYTAVATKVNINRMTNAIRSMVSITYNNSEYLKDLTVS